MREELRQRLFDAYPRLFALSHGGQNLLPLDRRIDCGDGWFPIIDALCEALQWELDRDGTPQIVVARIKNKLGAMSFQALGPRTDWQGGMIHMAAMLSQRIAED